MENVGRRDIFAKLSNGLGNKKIIWGEIERGREREPVKMAKYCSRWTWACKVVFATVILCLTLSPRPGFKNSSFLPPPSLLSQMLPEDMKGSAWWFRPECCAWPLWDFRPPRGDGNAFVTSDDPPCGGGTTKNTQSWHRSLVGAICLPLPQGNRQQEGPFPFPEWSSLKGFVPSKTGPVSSHPVKTWGVPQCSFFQREAKLSTSGSLCAVAFLVLVTSQWCWCLQGRRQEAPWSLPHCRCEENLLLEKWDLLAVFSCCT